MVTHGPLTLFASRRVPCDHESVRLPPEYEKLIVTGGGADPRTVMLPDPVEVVEPHSWAQFAGKLAG